MTRIGSVIATEIAPDDVRVHVANDRASLDLGAGVIVFPAERGPLDAQLRAMAKAWPDDTTQEPGT